MNNDVTLGKKARLYDDARIYNFQEDETAITIGNGSHVEGELCVLAYGGEIIIGDHCYIGENTKIYSGDSILIDDHVIIGHSCNISDNDSHEFDHLERAKGVEELLQFGYRSEKGKVKSAVITIEPHVWINFNVTILKGVRIGKGAIVAAGSIVTKDVAPFTMVAGNPARFIKSLITHDTTK
jgi:acetyltransferase-like isoleucine patch superfamily enzyme